MTNAVATADGGPPDVAAEAGAADAGDAAVDVSVGADGAVDASNVEELSVASARVYALSKASGYEFRVWLAAGQPSDLTTVEAIDVTSPSYAGSGAGSCALTVTLSNDGPAVGLPMLTGMVLTAFGDNAKSMLDVDGPQAESCSIELAPALASTNHEPKQFHLVGRRANGARWSLRMSSTD